MEELSCNQWFLIEENRENTDNLFILHDKRLDGN